MTILIDGAECLTLLDVARLTGVTTDALRQRQGRGRIDLNPVTTINGQHFYEKAAVEALVRKGLGL